VTSLPQPDNWKNRPVLIGLSFLFAVAVIVYSVAQAVTAVHRGDYVAALITSGFAVFSLGLVAAIVVAKLRSNTLRGVSDSTGTTLRPDPAGPWLLAVALVGAICSAALYVVFVPRGGVDIPFTVPVRQGRSLSLMWALLIIAVGGLIALIVRGGLGHLRLSPDGVEYSDIMHTRMGTWNGVTAVTDTAPNKTARHPISFVVKDEKPIVVKNASGYAPSGAALYWMVRHYWKHPENRAELTNGRALERLRDEQFEAE